MKNNQYMLLNIQLFAENDGAGVGSSTETEQVDDTTKTSQTEETPKEKMYSRDEVNKMMNAERNKIKEEYESKKSEAEKLAKMDAEQKLKYELDLKTKENEGLQNKINSMELQKQAGSYATEKGLPLGYIEDWDYTRETADSVKEKIDKLVKTRSNDLDGYLKDKLKQKPPKAVEESKDSEDPYIQGFKDYMKKNK